MVYVSNAIIDSILIHRLTNVRQFNHNAKIMTEQQESAKNAIMDITFDQRNVLSQIHSAFIQTRMELAENVLKGQPYTIKLVDVE